MPAKDYCHPGQEINQLFLDRYAVGAGPQTGQIKRAKMTLPGRVRSPSMQGLRLALYITFNHRNKPSQI